MVSLENSQNTIYCSLRVDLLFFMKQDTYKEVILLEL